MVLSACGGTTGGNNSNTPKQGGSIVDGISQEPSSLMPGQSTQAFASLVDYSVWAPLIYVDGDYAFQPGLLTQVPSATNGGVAVASDNKSETITLKLRSGLKWSDGSAITSDDVKYTIGLFGDKGYNTKNGFQATEVASVDTPDATTVKITLNTADVTFLPVSLVGFLTMPKAHYSSMDGAAVAADRDLKVTSGPFTLSEFVKGDHTTVKKNANYYQAPKPYLNQITYKYFPDAQTIVTALQSGQVDTAYFLPVDAKSTLQSISGYKLYQPQSGASYEALYFNLSNPLLQDVKVREALAIGFDSKLEISQIQKGNAAPTCDDGTGTFAHDTSLYGSTGYCSYGPDNVSGFDQAKANSILDAAGWVKGSDGIRAKGGKKLSLRISTTSGRQYREDSEALVQAAWKQIGVELKIVNHPSSDLFGPVLFPTDTKYTAANDQWDVAEFANSLAPDPDDHIIWASDQLTVTGGSNLTYYKNTNIDTLLKTQAGQFDPTQRKQTFSQIYKGINADVPTVWLYSAFDLSEYKANLHNYSPIAVGGIECWNVWDWWLS